MNGTETRQADPRGRLAHGRIRRLFQVHMDRMEEISADPLLFRRRAADSRRKCAGNPADGEEAVAENMDLDQVAGYVRLLAETEKLRREIYRCPTWKEEKDQQWKMRRLDAERQRLRGDGAEGRIILSAVDEEEPEDCPEV